MTREEAITRLKIYRDYLCKMSSWFDVNEIAKPFNMAIEALERPHGKWIRITQGAMPEQYICPFCHRTVEAYGVAELLSIRYPFCHCGADMRERREDGR